MPKQKDFTPAEFAAIVGVDRTTIWRHIKDKTLPVTKGKITDATIADVMRRPNYAAYRRENKVRIEKLRAKGVAG